MSGLKKIAQLTRSGLSAAAALAVACSAGCARLRPGQADAGMQANAEPEIVYLTLPAGRVTHVNELYKYVILECTSLPISGDEAKVYHDGQESGLLRILESRRGPFVVADIVAGEAERGDLVKFRCPVPRSTKEEMP